MFFQWTPSHEEPIRENSWKVSILFTVYLSKNVAHTSSFCSTFLQWKFTELWFWHKHPWKCSFGQDTKVIWWEAGLCLGSRIFLIWVQVSSKCPQTSRKQDTGLMAVAGRWATSAAWNTHWTPRPLPKLLISWVWALPWWQGFKSSQGLQCVVRAGNRSERTLLTASFLFLHTPYLLFDLKSKTWTFWNIRNI